MHDVDPRLYTTVIREMIRHENDVTNHRIMWLLIVQGLIAKPWDLTLIVACLLALLGLLMFGSLIFNAGPFG